MPTSEEFLQYIIENPDDTFAPLPYADWLDENYSFDVHKYNDKFAPYVRTLPIEQAFLALIASDINEPAHRLRYANFLEMAGQCDRADFIRQQLMPDQETIPGAGELERDWLRRVLMAADVPLPATGRGSGSGLERAEFQNGFITLNHDPKEHNTTISLLPEQFCNLPNCVLPLRINFYQINQ